ncbi:LOW QUALITY PROTEIN: uncharacterized protein LOC111297490 [Durio zibethinus]|uniref:LOW QUALITY PROTEIN: uncharacterized protein LOC111297490 n=1 Tax=Durio zibethinus TaxID=66656 RepID=A0A6P5Z5V1_DURZI|nr:LOW QUALITY PROTEIN: uncharacterized protein LOC111297490 [Durio zibethinus]
MKSIFTKVITRLKWNSSGIGGEQRKATSDTPGTKIKVEELSRISSHNEDHSYLKYGDGSSQEFGESTQFYKLSLKPDKTISTFNETVPVDEETQRDVNEYIASSSNFEEYKGHSENGVKKLETVSTASSCEIPSGLFSSASVAGMIEEPTPATEENNKDSELDHGIVQPADSMASGGTDVACRREIENQKNFTFWKLIYQNMVTGLDAELETQKPLPGVNSEEQVENQRNAHQNNDPYQEISRTGKAMSIEVHEASNRKLEFSQSDAIKLVQQAFDKILSEIPDHSSDNQSIASEITSDQDFLLKKQDEGKEMSISTSSNSIEDRMMQDQEEMQLQMGNKIASEEVKAAQIEGKKSGRQMPNSWSNLKNTIILKIFVNPVPPVDKDPEAEKIQLRHQNMKGRKSAEEWMLDHALCQVISTLAPSQKRKVALLVLAFETAIPLPENGDDMRSNAAAFSPTTFIPADNEFSVHNGNSAKTENGSEILAGKALNLEMRSKDDQDQVSESHRAYQQSPSSEMSGTDLKKAYTGAVNDNNVNKVLIVMDVQPNKDLSSEFCPENEEVIQRISKEEISILDSEVCKNIEKMDLDSSDLINSADQHPGKPECPTAVGEGAQPKYKSLHSSLEHSESNFAADISKLEKQKYLRLWKPSATDSAIENGSQLLQNLTDEEAQDDDAIKHSRDNNGDCQSSFATDDTSDNQSVTVDVIPHQELPETKQCEEKKRRFVKALGKVKEFNPRGPQYLPLDPAPESEKVLLRHQNMEDRKNAEEWMLDYALQQVAKLTPERKRRVGLLVEAFETVILLYVDVIKSPGIEATASPAKANHSSSSIGMALKHQFVWEITSQ